MIKLLFTLFALPVFFTVFSQPQKLYFDPAYATGIPQSKLFDEIKYIPLETNKESIFGRVNQLIVTQKYFIVWDSDTDAIYFFDKAGKFIKKYKDRGYKIRSLRFDRSKNALFISAFNKSYNPTQKDVQQVLDNPFKNEALKYAKIVYYDLADVMKEKITPVSGFDIVMADPHIFNKDQWVYSYIYANKNWEDVTDYELKVSDGRNVLKSYFPYSRQKSSIFYGSPERISFFRTFSDSSLLFTRPFNYTIYKLSPDTIKEEYTLILPMANTLPKTFFTQTFESRSALEDYKTKNNALVWGLENILEYKNLLFFSLDYWRSYNERNFIFDKTTQQFFNLNKISPDSLNSFLPVTGFRIQHFDNGHLYSSISSTAMFQNFEANKARNPAYSAVLKNYFQKSKSTANPVILQLKPKQKIN